MKLAILGLAVVLALVGLSASAHANLLSNPGFETNSFTSVSTPFDTSISTDIWGRTTSVFRSADARTGNFSLEVSQASNESNKGFEQIVTVGNGTNGTFTIYHKQVSSSSVFKAYLRYLDSNRTLITSFSKTFTVGLTASWASVSVTGTKPGGAAFAQVIIVTNSSGVAKGRFDDASYTES